MLDRLWHERCLLVAHAPSWLTSAPPDMKLRNCRKYVRQVNAIQQKWNFVTANTATVELLLI